MSQWLRKKIISFMGNVYVWLDKGLQHETKNILGVNIHSDFQDMNRRELCQHIADKFGWEKDAFWNLESTQKIRLCCQQARNMETAHKESIKMMVLLDEVEDRHDLRNWEELKELSANLRSGEEE